MYKHLTANAHTSNLVAKEGQSAGLGHLTVATVVGVGEGVLGNSTLAP